MVWMALETLETLPEARRLWYASSAHESAIGGGPEAGRAIHWCGSG